MEFNKKIFNTGYAIYYTILQCISVLGFVIMVIAVILGAATNLHITIPNALVWFFFISFVTFPIVSIIKVGYRRNLRWSRLSMDDNVITYDKLTEKMWTAVGHVEEHHLYKIADVICVQYSRRFYTISGTIQHTIINNGRILSVDNVDLVKIPHAYSGMEHLKG